MMYALGAFAALVLLVIGWRFWMIWTFQTPESLCTPRAFRALQIRAEQSIPPPLAQPALEEEAKRLRKLGFRELGVMVEKIRQEHATREFCAPERNTYASLMDFHGEPRTFFSTILADGTLIHTGASDRAETEMGKLLWRGLDADLEDRLADHVDAVNERCAATGSSPATRGVIEQRMEMCREFYRYYTGAYRSE